MAGCGSGTSPTSFRASGVWADERWIGQSPGAPDLAVQRRRAVELVAACSIEISPRDDFAGERLRELLDPGMTVFVNHPGSVTHHDIVAACARLRRAGFNPVPHIAVRRLASFTQANDFLQRAAAEAEVSGRLDHRRRPRPSGGSVPRQSRSLGVRPGRGSRPRARLPLPGIPRAIRGSPRAPSMRFCGPRWHWRSGRPRSVAGHPVRLRGRADPPLDRHIASPGHQPAPSGLASPGRRRVATLAKFAVRCGIGASLRALARGHTAFARIFAEAGPDALIGALVAEEDPARRSTACTSSPLAASVAPPNGWAAICAAPLRRASLCLHRHSGAIISIALLDIPCLQRKTRPSAKFRCRSAANRPEFRCRPECPNRIQVTDTFKSFGRHEVDFGPETVFSLPTG